MKLKAKYEKSFMYDFFFFYRARSICPRCTAAYRLTVRPQTPTVV